MKSFADRIITWQRQHGRHTLPWQQSRDPYRIWLSEIMLQQTQVATVVGYYTRFLDRFPTLDALAAASEDEVLTLWSGLGYYSRARNLHAAARHIMLSGGVFPDNAEAMSRLPGIGRSTAAAIAALAYGERNAILDGNVKRVLARHAGIDGWPGEKGVESRLWACAEARLPKREMATYTQGMMDLGALVCTRARPVCHACPVASDCVARSENRTDCLPAPRPKKLLPDRRIQMLVLHHDHEFLLVKRPDKGIWGGLWSLPEIEADSDGSSHVTSAWGCHVNSQHPLPRIIHGFTHFRLHIQPHYLNLTHRGDPTPGHVWLALADCLQAALPAPVRRLLSGLHPSVSMQAP